MPSATDAPTITLPEIELPKIDMPVVPFVLPFVLPVVLPSDAASLVGLLQAQQRAFADTFIEMVDAIHAQALAAYTEAAKVAARSAAIQASNEYLIRMIEQAKLARHRLYGVGLLFVQ